jgi:hypothetical protein
MPVQAGDTSEQEGEQLPLNQSPQQYTPFIIHTTKSRPLYPYMQFMNDSLTTLRSVISRGAKAFSPSTTPHHTTPPLD